MLPRCSLFVVAPLLLVLTAGTAAADDATAADELWRSGLEAERRMDLATAHAAFASLTEQAPRHTSAPEAAARAARIDVARGRDAAAGELLWRFGDRLDPDALRFAADLAHRLEEAGTALRLYRRWLEEFGEENPEVRVHVVLRVHEMTDVAVLPRVVVQACSEPGLSRGVRDRCARSAMEHLRARSVELLSRDFTGWRDEDEVLWGTWMTELAAFERSADDFIARHPTSDARYDARLLVGFVHQRFADLLRGLPGYAPVEFPCGTFLASEDIEFPPPLADPKPLYERATAEFRRLVADARASQRHHSAVGRALHELSRIDPDRWEVTKSPILALVQSDVHRVAQ